MHNNERLYFLDWIRICAFFLLILYHTGMYYVTWDWHVKSPQAGHAIEPLMLLSSPWRLSLLFFVSGVASAFLARKLPAGRFLRQRSGRLLLPLLFGMLVIVPPQPYFEVVEKLGYAGSYGDFMGLYLRAYHGFCKDGHCLDLPTWNHLWFVAYLWVYTLVLAALLASIGSARIAAVGTRLARLLTGWKAIVLPAALLGLVRIALKPYFEETHALVDDWFNHATYLPLFLAGAALAGQRAFWRELETLRFAALGIALACWAALVTYHWQPEAVQTWTTAARAVWALCQWCAIVAVCGFGHRHLGFDSAKRRYLTQAVFPVYIAHQTLIVCFSRLLRTAALPPAVEGLVLVVLTLTASFGIFEVVRRVPLLRPWFGLKRDEVPETAAVPAPRAAA
ncbi:surface polysaccharide O-acyltransferase-like enzyme [Pseudoduganella flava]|uniref:Acyltransferase family protein n=1 Tax=Pseudoduganella flava TaxID=871742 RepID=A0A562PZP1_9BURK|nr:acyltransferase family protein [Pseudoduganella flava]QGZ38536.1 acyltransferase family protein [Pseudoduganella flava]TWI49905.1 surface polysaccharide O-acyltransferase-like enzyme [Pseudoduganella flava]